MSPDSSLMRKVVSLLIKTGFTMKIPRQNRQRNGCAG